MQLHGKKQERVRGKKKKTEKAKHNNKVVRALLEGVIENLEGRILKQAYRVAVESENRLLQKGFTAYFIARMASSDCMLKLTTCRTLAIRSLCLESIMKFYII